MVATDATKANCGMQYILRAFRSSSAAVIKYSELEKSIYNIDRNTRNIYCIPQFAFVVSVATINRLSNATRTIYPTLFIAL